MEEFVRKNPWLGLESYKEGEVLYGRDDDIRDLSQCVLNDTDTLLYGKSGIGKSSLLNAGILPAARLYGYLPVLIRLSHKDEHTYLHQIHQSIISAIMESNDVDEGNTEVANKEYTAREITSVIKEVVPCEHPESESLYEYFHRHTFHNVNGERIKLLIIFDQFEEIFTLQECAQKKKTFFAHLADLLNNVMPDELQPKVEVISEGQEEVKIETEADFANVFDNLVLDVAQELPEYVTDNEIHFVFTIREDFLSEFEYYAATIPSLKQNRYGLRSINEEQATQIIMRPVPGLVDKSVAQLIIEKITGKNDFKLDGVPELDVDSAVLSLYLNRLYDASDGQSITKELVEEKGGEIIADFYDDALSEVSDSTIEYLEDMLLNGNGRRDNITVYDAIHEGGISEEEIDVLCNKKKILRKFNYAGELRIEYVHDILCPVVAQNKAERATYAEVERQNEKLKKIRIQRTITSLGIFILLAGIIFYVLGFHITITQRYASITKVFGRFVGVEPLTPKQASYREFHFVLKKRGLFAKPYYSMECRNRFDSLSTDHGISPYVLVGQVDKSILADKLQTVCKWEFISDPYVDSLIIQERAYDKGGNLIYAFNYNKPQKPQKKSKSDQSQKESKEQDYYRDTKKVMIGSYVDEQGLPLEFIKDEYRFVRITYDDSGHDMLVEYFDWDGMPATNADGAYQAYYEYDELGQRVSMSSLNMYGKRMIDNAGNCGMIITYDGYRMIETLSVDEFGREKAVNSGYSRVKYEYDDYGRLIHLSFWQGDKPVVAEDNNFHQLTRLYDDNTNTETILFYNADGEDYGSRTIRYDAKGNELYDYREYLGGQKEIREAEYDDKGTCVKQSLITIEKEDTIGIYNFTKVANVETRRWEGSAYTEYINKTTYDDRGRIVEDVYYDLDSITPYLCGQYHRCVNFYTEIPESATTFYTQIDSTLMYDCTQLQSIEVKRKQVYYVTTFAYASDTTLNGKSLCREDEYGNTIEELRGPRKACYFVNAKNNEIRDGAVGFLTRYQFPIPYFEYYTWTPDHGWVSAICDENGNIDIPSTYTLPEIYSGDREFEAIFIECADKGLVWHGVILESDAGVRYGQEDYTYDNFGNWDDVVCLNLTTMRVETYKLYELDYWTIYPCPITQLEYDLYNEHYATYLESQSEDASVVVATVLDEGYLADEGYDGQFFVLKLGDWDCARPIMELATIVEEHTDVPKDVVLLPFEFTDDGISLKDIVHIPNRVGMLGVSLNDVELSQSFYQENILGVYEKWCE